MGLITDTYGNFSFGKATAWVALAIAAVFGGCGICNNWKYSEGDRTGMINKISTSGFVWDSYEGQMALEGISGSGNSLGANVWDFAIDNYWPANKRDELAGKLRDAMNSGIKVKVHYQQMVQTWPRRSGSRYLVQSVEPINSLVGKTNNFTSSSSRQNQIGSGVATTVDGKNYLLKHDTSGKLRVTELREVQ